MSTQLIISAPQWPGTEPDLVGYEKDMLKKQQTLLKKELAKIAEHELRETEHSRQECLRQLKAWIEQNEDIRNCIMGKCNCAADFFIGCSFHSLGIEF